MFIFICKFFFFKTIAAGILRNTSNNAISMANALSLYMSSVANPTSSLYTANTLSAYEIDSIVDNLNGVNLTINSNASFLMVQQPMRDNNVTLLGASFTRGVGGNMVDTSNKENITKSVLSAAAIINKETLSNVTSLNILIIDRATNYENVDNSTNKTLTSSVIVVNVQRNAAVFNSTTIRLYFNPSPEYKRNGSGNYLCSFYDNDNSQWNESGCTAPQYNSDFDRYECSCNHLTSFALIWLPESSLTANATKQLDAQDIASLVFQSLSIICFLAIIIHAMGMRILYPSMGMPALNLLPLVSMASTIILFVFFIALGMTVYTQTSSSTSTQCFTSSNVLMFLVYFFLIFMFCVKTCVGYFYYQRFVHLFPQPSHRKLFIMLMISLFISLVCVGLAIGFDYRSSYKITRLYPYKLCWFTQDVIYYFMTIPIGIFLLINIITIILVAISITTHARNAPTSQQINERLKRCVIILLSSCLTQGIGWCFGPFISFVSSTAGVVLEWFFIIFNGLEGLWAIILYVFIRLQRLDEQRHTSAAIELFQSSQLPIGNDKKFDDENVYMKNNGQVIQNNVEKERRYSLNNLRKREN